MKLLVALTIFTIGFAFAATLAIMVAERYIQAHTQLPACEEIVWLKDHPAGLVRM